ncbi:MAG: L-serine ammonia-lyase, iron-sulfur-dependent, subunit alpha [Candidatus Bathyarchaeota archaeon]|nr:L-serine ammonia-lyase, iron-sulfur-dependent, subunit alpha [Candidatus Bathyarchaeota archaeon]
MEFRKIQDLIRLAKNKKSSIGKIVIEFEAKSSEKSKKEIWKKMENNWRVMKQSIDHGLTRDIRPITGLTGGNAKRIANANLKIIDDTMKKAISRALSVAEGNASMKKIVAAPTAGSSGIIPAAITVTIEKLKIPEENAVQALFTAASVGLVIANNATISGAEGGCQSECGVASAMAAAAVVELAGGSPDQVGHAVAIALKNMLGLVCDPVAGLVEVPCIKRNVIGVVNALVSAEMALAGIESIIPVDEVILALDDVSKRMPLELKETACGGLAITPTGKRIKEKFIGKY